MASSAAEAEPRAQALARVDHLFGDAKGDIALAGRDPVVVRDLRIAALHHPDAHIRRSCLWALDHFANDASMDVFAAALEDPAHFVRDIALHSLACESCKCEEANAADIVAPLIAVLEHDPKPDLRVKALGALLRFISRDERARDAIVRATSSNSDAQVRRCAADAVQHGTFVPPKKRYDRSQRRRAALGHGTMKP